MCFYIDLISGITNRIKALNVGKGGVYCRLNWYEILFIYFICRTKEHSSLNKILFELMNNEPQTAWSQIFAFVLPSFYSHFYKFAVFKI